MTNIHRKIRKVVPKEWMKAHPIQDEVSKQGVSTADSLQRRMSPEIPSAEDERAIPMADEEELARVRRKRAAGRGGGRSSTVLSEDRFGS